MRVVKIPKKNGSYRTIYIPTKEERRNLRVYLPIFVGMVKRMESPGVIHGFMPGRSPVTNAIQHIGFGFTLNMDLKDFFDSVTKGMVVEILCAAGESLPMSLSVTFEPEADSEATGDLHVVELPFFPDGAARQGLPTSPAICNIAACPMDRKILGACQSLGNVSYTRYADDLCFSFDDYAIYKPLKGMVEHIVAESGFVVNESKTHLQSSVAGRRKVTGVAVDDKAIYPTRKLKRRLRAATHQGLKGPASGLREVAKNKLPGKWTSEKNVADSKWSEIWGKYLEFT